MTCSIFHSLVLGLLDSPYTKKFFSFKHPTLTVVSRVAENISPLQLSTNPPHGRVISISCLVPRTTIGLPHRFYPCGDLFFSEDKNTDKYMTFI